jgi:hypothetical protein
MAGSTTLQKKYMGVAHLEVKSTVVKQMTKPNQVLVNLENEKVCRMKTLHTLYLKNPLYIGQEAFFNSPRENGILLIF